jgi:hypothetical protein
MTKKELERSQRLERLMKRLGPVYEVFAPSLVPSDIRPLRKNHKRLAKNAGWVAQNVYDATCNYYNSLPDHALLATIKSDGILPYTTIPFEVVTEDVLWVAKAILKERKKKRKDIGNSGIDRQGPVKTKRT